VCDCHVKLNHSVLYDGDAFAKEFTGQVRMLGPHSRFPGEPCAIAMALEPVLHKESRPTVISALVNAAGIGYREQLEVDPGGRAGQQPGTWPLIKLRLASCARKL